MPFCGLSKSCSQVSVGDDGIKLLELRGANRVWTGSGRIAADASAVGSSDATIIMGDDKAAL